MTQNGDGGGKLGMTVGAALKRGVIAPPLRHLPVLVHMRGRPGGLGLERATLKRQRQQG